MNHNIPGVTPTSFPLISCLIKAFKTSPEDSPVLLVLILWSKELAFSFSLSFLQVTVEYKDNMGAMEPQRVHTVVISVQHRPDITLEEIRRNLMEKVVKVVIPAKYLDDKTIYHLLPSGKFLIGGPQVGKD